MNQTQVLYSHLAIKDSPSLIGGLQPKQKILVVRYLIWSGCKNLSTPSCGHWIPQVCLHVKESLNFLCASQRLCTWHVAHNRISVFEQTQIKQGERIFPCLPWTLSHESEAVLSSNIFYGKLVKYDMIPV